MVADLEQKYRSYICNVWQRTLGASRDICELHKDQEDIHKIVSSMSIRFLQDALKSLETEKG